MVVLELIENFNKVDFSYLKVKPDISFLENYKNRKIAMLGYEKWQTTLDSYEFKDVLEYDLSRYDLIVIGPKINYKKRSYIKQLLNFLKKKKLDYIFYGYSSYTNLNLENTKNMFRPIDISKSPFNQKIYEIIDDSFDRKTIGIYIASLVMTIYTNYNSNLITYRLFLIILILFVLIIPRKKIVYIKNG